ncbi:MAG: hypothetical protein J6Y19_07760 [Kiritimatiellae bacterium]|nr:hypothetical protein [Kiritimatiellia bacterium]
MPSRPFSFPYLSRILPLILVFLFAVSIRLTFQAVYGPALGNDSNGYLAVATMLHERDFAGYTAWRTPGYPYFLNIFHSSPSSVVTAQICLSLFGVFLLSIALFNLVRHLGITVFFATLLSVSVNLLAIDGWILTESLATTLFSVITAWIALDASFHTQRFASLSAAGLGLLVGVLVLTRPQYIAVIPVLAFAFLFSRPLSQRLLRLAVFLPFASAPVLALITFNATHVGKPILSSTLPFNLSQHTLPFIESAEPDDPRHLVPEIVRLRDQYWPLAQSLDDNRAFIPRPPMEPASDDADYLLHLSLSAIRHRPGAYCISVFNAWLRFWRVSFLYDSDCLHVPGLDRWIRLLWTPLKLIWLAIEFFFLATLLALPFKWVKQRSIGPVEMVSLLILSVSVLQALVEYGDNSRYAIPMLPAMSFVVFHSLGHSYPCAEANNVLSTLSNRNSANSRQN